MGKIWEYDMGMIWELWLSELEIGEDKERN